MGRPLIQPLCHSDLECHIRARLPTRTVEAEQRAAAALRLLSSNLPPFPTYYKHATKAHLLRTPGEV